MNKTHPQARRRTPWLKFWHEWAKPMLTILLVTCAIRSTLADWNDVPSGSMTPTILEGDRILVNKLAYDLKVPFTTWRLAEWDHPKRGEIVVFFSPWDGARLVKRVVGLPGDIVALVNNQLSINGQSITYEPAGPELVSPLVQDQSQPRAFAHEHLGAVKHLVLLRPGSSSKSSFAPITIPAKHYFMMGDSRDNSFDSRYFGPVERKRIIGRAAAVVASVDANHHYWPRWSRFFTALR